MPLAPPLCWSCHAPAARESPLCPRCRRRLRFAGGQPLPFAGLGVWAAVLYEGPARELVRALKFRAAAGLADAMAAQMLAAGAPGATLVPVPLAPGRRRRRGFNQAALLARCVAARSGLPLADVLVRAGGARSQVGRGRAARLSGPGGRIEVRAPPPRRVLLVDDVVTTGATLGACARALRAAGAQEVAALVYARTPGR